MKLHVLIAGLCLVAIGASVTFAEGLPSRSKLDRLGLSSMQVASDTEGAEVRGSGFIQGNLWVHAIAGTASFYGTLAGSQGRPFTNSSRALGLVTFDPNTGNDDIEVESQTQGLATITWSARVRGGLFGFTAN